MQATHAPEGALLTVTRRAQLALAWLFVAGIVAQVFFAGLGVLVDPSWFSAHRAMPPLLFLLGVILLAFTVAARQGGVALALAALVPVLVAMQWVFLYAPADLGVPTLRGLHAVNALALFWIGTHLASPARYRVVRGEPHGRR